MCATCLTHLISFDFTALQYLIKNENYVEKSAEISYNDVACTVGL